MTRKFELLWSKDAQITFDELKNAAIHAAEGRKSSGKQKSTPQEGLFKQLVKCLDLLESNPRHPGLQTHEFTSIEHPYKKGQKVWEAYVQNQTPAAYRVFWCYGPEKGQITLIAITPHP